MPRNGFRRLFSSVPRSKELRVLRSRHCFQIQAPFDWQFSASYPPRVGASFDAKRLRRFHGVICARRRGNAQTHIWHVVCINECVDDIASENKMHSAFVVTGFNVMLSWRLHLSEFRRQKVGSSCPAAIRKWPIPPLLASLRRSPQYSPERASP